MSNRVILLTIFLLFSVLFAQDVTVSAYVDRNRAFEGENIRLTIEAKAANFGSIQNVTFPDPMPLPIIAGPSRSTGSSTTIVNFQASTQKTETLTYTLRAESAGTHRILPIAMTIDGNVYATRPIDIVISTRTTQATPNTQQPGAQNPFAQQQTPSTQNPFAQQQIPPQQQQQQQPAQDTFIVASVDKTTVVRNEMIIVHYKLYTRSNIQNITLGNEPTFTGFWKEELYQAERIQWQQEVYDGMRYNTFLVRSLALFPSREGNYTIPAYEINVEILVPGRGFFDFGTMRTVKATSRPINIRVNPLPELEEGRNFIGAVGRFDITSSLSANEGEAGNSLTFRINVSGSGNFNQIRNPNMPEVRGIRFMTPETNDNKNQSSTTFSGRRTFIYPVLLQESGTIEIPEIDITWFDTASRRYQSKTLPAQTIEVSPSTHSVMTVAGESQRLIVESQRNDIEYTKTALSTTSFKFLYQTFWYWIFYLLLIVSLVSHHFYILDVQRQNADTHYRRDKRAMAVMRKYLKAADHYARQNSMEFYNSAYIGLSQFLTDKLKLPRGATEKAIFEALQDKMLSSDLITDLKTCFDKINFVKFSNADNSSVDILQDIEMVKRIINSLMVELNKKDKQGTK